MLYLTIIGIVCAVVAPVAAVGIRISNETGIRDSSRKLGIRELLWVASESLKLDLSDDFDEDVPRTIHITTRSWKRKRNVKTNLKDVAADAEIDMNKRIEKLAREISQHDSKGETLSNGVSKAEKVRHPRGSRLKRRIHRRRMSLLNPFKKKPAAFNEASTLVNAMTSTTEHTASMGVFERKMKEFHAQQKMKSNCKYPFGNEEIKSTVQSSTQQYSSFSESTNKPNSKTPSTTYLPPYIFESTDFTVRNDADAGLSPERYLKIRHALRNYLIKTNVLSSKEYHCRRKKRCSHFPNCKLKRCRKLPPMVCLPYIKRGQDDILKFLISVMQSMLDKSSNSRKPYSLDKFRRKPCRLDYMWDVMDQEQVTELAPCPKLPPCGPFAIVPFPMPYPPVTPVFPCLCSTPPTTATPLLPTGLPLCPPTPIIPIPPITPTPIILSEIPKTRTCHLFTSPSTVIIPTYFPPWPTTKPPCLSEPYPRELISSLERQPVPGIYLDTFSPWPTPPFKTPHFRKRLPIHSQRVNKLVDYPEGTRLDVTTPPEGYKLRKYEFETVYDSPSQETIEEAEIDINTRHFDYDPDNTIDFSVFDMTTSPYESVKMKKFPRRYYKKRYPNQLKHDYARRYNRRNMPLRQKRNEISKDETEILTEATTVTSTTTTTLKTTTGATSSNHRNEYDDHFNKNPTMRSASIVKGPKRMSNHPQTKVFAKVFPESYSYITTEIPTTKEPKVSEKTTVPTNTNTSSLMHLQLLAVCQGYLEMIKLLKMNNQTRGEDDLVRYCEQEISKGFDSTRAKKSVAVTTVAAPTESYPKQLQPPASRKEVRNKVVVDILRSPVYREMRSHFLEKSTGRVSNRERRRRRKKRRRGFRRKPFRRTTTDIVDSVRLLRKKKGALVSWLFNKEKGDVEDEEDDGGGGGGSTESGNTSSTSSVRREETSATPQPDTIYPVYAKMYGYDRGGELTDIEVLLRSLGERNETREIAKNVTVLAMLMNPEEEERDMGLVEDVESEFKFDSANFGGKASGELDRKKGNITSMAMEEEVNEMMEAEETTVTEVSTPEATTILGHATTLAPKKNHTWNGTYAQAVSSAKELVKDYTIEFLNYAVYIIPIMFILLFLVCCLCFILKIMTHNRKKRKRARGKRKETTPPSSESDSDTTESYIDRKRKKSKLGEAKRKGKKFWSRSSEDEEGGIGRRWKRSKGNNGEGLNPNERKFLKMLKRKKNVLNDVEDDDNEERALVSPKKRVSYNESNDTDEVDTRLTRHKDSVAKERRELIALLEELKNLEDRDKKEAKSVFVQYMTTDYDSDAGGGGGGGYWKGSRPYGDDVDDFRRLSDDMSAELLRGTPHDIAHKFDLLTRMFDRLLVGDMSPRKKTILMEEMENFKRRLGYRKWTRLKDNGVLCRP